MPPPHHPLVGPRAKLAPARVVSLVRARPPLLAAAAPAAVLGLLAVATSAAAAPVTLSPVPGRVDEGSLGLALGADGTAVATWATDSGAFVALRPGAGAGWRVEALPGGDAAYAPVVAVAGDGTAVAAWVRGAGGALYGRCAGPGRRRSAPRCPSPARHGPRGPRWAWWRCRAVPWRWRGAPRGAMPGRCGSWCGGLQPVRRPRRGA